MSCSIWEALVAALSSPAKTVWMWCKQANAALHALLLLKRADLIRSMLAWMSGGMRRAQWSRQLHGCWRGACASAGAAKDMHIFFRWIWGWHVCICFVAVGAVVAGAHAVAAVVIMMVVMELIMAALSVSAVVTVVFIITTRRGRHVKS